MSADSLPPAGHENEQAVPSVGTVGIVFDSPEELQTVERLLARLRFVAAKNGRDTVSAEDVTELFNALDVQDKVAFARFAVKATLAVRKIKTVPADASPAASSNSPEANEKNER